MSKIILPYDIIGYINSFLPRHVHPISKFIKEYVNMQNITNKIITVPWHGVLPNEPWRDNFYNYIITLRYWQVNEVFNKRNWYFHMHPSFNHKFNCFIIRMNAYNTEMNAYD